MTPGKRLMTAAEFVNGGKIIDIGTDHGYLPVWLILNGKCEFASAADINPMPLESAKRTARKYGVFDKMSFYLSDGFDSVDGYYDTAFLCGMGGILIADILERGKGKFGVCVSQPMTNAEVLRKYLWENGYSITDEKYSVEYKKAYTVIKAEKSDIITEYSYADTYLGKKRPYDECYFAYVKKIFLSAQKRLSGKIHDGVFSDDEEALVSECKLILKEK